ncbi:MAG: cytochrome c oxidase subunit 3 [Porticoccaceae bacterium]|nr:cytochrome c oxidase subunit 3 [Porticoccaceae bacterium]
MSTGIEKIRAFPIMKAISATTDSIPDHSQESNNSPKGIWIFVSLDMLIFSLFFLVFLIEKTADYEVFRYSQSLLDARAGFINTLLLLTSSWLLVLATNTINQFRKKAILELLLAMVCGFFFVVFKIYEYHEKISHGVSISENTFFTFYFVLTFIHFCHVIGGLIALYILLKAFMDKMNKNPEHLAETIGVYWHMVDLLWVFLFLLLYLMI